MEMIGPDERMDHVGNKRRPANPLPVKCPHCTFPDLEFVTSPYLLAKGIPSPTETTNANVGNFLVRERVRRILELAVPGACSFYPTADRKSNKPAPWWLAVPNHLFKTAMPTAKPPFCSKCGEPKVWHCPMGPVWKKMTRYDSGGVDVFKSASWYSRSTVEDDFAETNRYRKADGFALLTWPYCNVGQPSHPERWTRKQLDRDLYFSVRLEQLLKRAKVRGQLVRLFSFSEVKTSAADEAWIEEKLNLLATHGLVDPPKIAGSKSANAWFRQFLKRNAGKRAKPADFAGVEKKHRLALPQSYKDFIATVGQKSFEDVNETGGFTAHILPPARLDFKNYRRGKVADLDEEQSQVDGVAFASTDHGDVFVFDVSAKEKDYPVFWHDHEQNTLEPFAPNFAECVKRFAQKS